MIKRTQNKVAESRYALPVMVIYAIAVWMASGYLLPIVPFTLSSLLSGAWVQLVCFLLSAYLMVELNNSNALIRIYSRMVSCSFIALSCAACFLFDSMAGAIVQLCSIATCLCLFRAYQDKTAVGWTFYAFLCIGLASVVTPYVLYYVPLVWFVMYFLLTALSWRTFAASLLGLITPYWFILPFAIYQGGLTDLGQRFMSLLDFEFPYNYSLLTINELSLYVLVAAFALTGFIHYWRSSYNDSIRVRQLYGCFSLMTFVTLALLALQPQHYDMLMHLLIVNVSPLIAHFLSLTHTRITNIAFYVITAAVVILTIFNLWMPSLKF